MNAAERKQWLQAAVLVGIVYFVVGFGFALFAAASAQTRVRWNRLAFLTSAIVFVVHIGYEHFRLRSGALLNAWHTSLAVALGSFGLALAANIHELRSDAAFRPRILIALVAWPLVTGVPAFIVALLVATGLRLVRSRI